MLRLLHKSKPIFADYLTRILRSAILDFTIFLKKSRNNEIKFKIMPEC